ncbi:hypothetical protein HYH03_004569 [Edaphochlamys debaryana]|uniref:Uncharacterized protein n=1 Tax=Edaphochlamys debaryana TaxID=47281 RepID=A0A835Y948_9CHLO|nr:hypothetical protein HYH03_004569 [Edaphochlamys debaryana]|eukprot:KAG2497414.1 hypothetical protein HYH03_004569 [Edaphochlamys debaryana]
MITLGKDSLGIVLCVTELLLAEEVVPRATRTLESVRRLKVASQRPWDDACHAKLYSATMGCTSVLAFAGRSLRRIAAAVSCGQLPPTSGVPGSRTSTAADGAATLLAQLTAPELAAALAGLFECVRRSSPPATVWATSLEGVTVALAAQSLDAFAAAPGWVAAANEAALFLSNFAVTRTCLLAAATAVIYEMIACTHYSAAAAASARPPGYVGGAASLVNAAAASTQLPPASRPLLALQRLARGVVPAGCHGGAVGRLLAGPRVQWLQRALLERWLLDARAGVAVAEANGQPPPYDVSANDSDGEQASCGWRMRDRLSVFRLNRYALGASLTPQVDAEKDDTARLSAALSQVPRLTAHLAQALTWQLQDDGPSGGQRSSPGGEPAAAGAPAAAAAVLPLSLPPLSYSMRLVCRMLEAACLLLRAGGAAGVRALELAADGDSGAAGAGALGRARRLRARPARGSQAGDGCGNVVGPGGGVGGNEAAGRPQRAVGGGPLLGPLSGLSPAARANLAARLASCGCLRVANSLMLLHASRNPEDTTEPSPKETTVRLLLPLLALTGLTGGGGDSGGGGGSGGGAASGKDFAGLAATLAKLASRADGRVVEAMQKVAGVPLAHEQLDGQRVLAVLLPTDEPRMLGYHLACMMPYMLRRLAAAPGTGAEAAAAAGSGAPTAAAAAAAAAAVAGEGGNSAGAAGEESKELRPALVALARSFVRLGGDLLLSHHAMVNGSMEQFERSVQRQQARAGSGQDAGEGPEISLVRASTLTQGLRVAEAGAAALEQGLAQGWLAGPRALEVA